MLRKLLSLSVVFSVFFNAYAGLPEYEIITSDVPSSEYGTITRMSVKSGSLEGNVTIDVWTPSEYDISSEKRYPVIYAYDGQNLFDVAFSFAGVPWALDRACLQLASDDDFSMPIIVGINNRGSEGLRPSDYFPENALQYIPPQLKDKTAIFQTCNDIFLGNEEAAFVAIELKPLIDNLYNTAPGMSTTFAMGSSMGALASMYLLCEYPGIFGGAACMSTHWIGSLDLNPDFSMNDDEICANAILEYLNNNIPDDGMHRLYLDQGTDGWDAGYWKYEVTAREIVRDRGYTEETGHLYTYDAEGAGHNEWFWQQRVKIPLKFLLSKKAIEESGLQDIVPDSVPVISEQIIFDLYGRRYPDPSINSLPPGIYIRNGESLFLR
ncbi:MAG: esterase family protein [Muribaculaceae bacterium]|nr:esterase family protein [Muribaculaceae bacterium]